MKKLNIPCYLTGGTALGRFYFFHRYSDDLDFFTNQDEHYPTYVQKLFKQFETEQQNGHFSIEYNLLQRHEHFTQIFLSQTIGDEKIILKIDFVNDVASHYGEILHDPILGKIDSWQNILSKKLTSIFRYEAKDIVDLLVIARHKKFHWMSILDQAKTKEAAVDPIVIFEILKSFPKDELATIKWMTSVDPDLFIKDLHQIAQDIFEGTANTLS